MPYTFGSYVCDMFLKLCKVNNENVESENET